MVDEIWRPGLANIWRPAGPASAGPEAGTASGAPEAGQTIGGLTDTAARRAALAAAMIQTFEFRIHALERWSEAQLAALRDPEPPTPGPGPAPPGVPAASGKWRQGSQ